jgi:broad specificity phosphatase PhoE
MKWPHTLTAVRHAESAYNILRDQKQEDPLFKELKRAHNRLEKDPEHARKIAEEFIAEGKYILGTGDHDTAVTKEGLIQAKKTGEKLHSLIDLPDVVLVSSYDRTHHTLGQLALGWPELGEVKTVEDERLREQEQGLTLLYNDWRVFECLHPEQKKLRELQGPYWYRYPQGENVPDIRERNRSLLGTMTRDYSGQNVLWITHHLSILALRANLERLNADQFIELDRNHKPINCGATIYRGEPGLGSDGRLVLDKYNQKLY